MLENGTGTPEMLAHAGRILVMIDDKMDFLLVNESLTERESIKTCDFLTFSCTLHARYSKLLQDHRA